jgi:hypothetical protein
MSKFQFSDERLQKAAAEGKSALEQRIQKLDKISNDIRQLERYLEESGVRERIEHKFSGGACCVGDLEALKEFGENPAEEVCEYLVWEKSDNPDRWRLTYVKTRRDGWFSDCIPDGFSFEDEPKKVDHRPLIETPAEVRLRAGEALPELFAAIANNTKVSRLS